MSELVKDVGVSKIGVSGGRGDIYISAKVDHSVAIVIWDHGFCYLTMF